ncbi:MAG TPA: DUF5996 family protein [Pyrinomonadaceae bacterium]|jgi:hypothetical protein|nr:DUF5996 family protein [Pyrinomonadaceae bacterium]
MQPTKPDGTDEVGGWPSLPFNEWRETCATLHMWTQVVGKVRLAQAPHVNHWWQVPLYVTARGLTTSPMPYGERTFQIDFDFQSHRLLIETTDGDARELQLAPRTVADFYREFMSALRSLGLEVNIWTTPVEVANPIPFEEDETHAAYQPEYANRFWRVLVQSERLLQQFRSRFVGKCSPVHFFWGSFDLAVTRFSGRRAPPHPGTPGVADSITREAYSHEVSSAGLWPGGDALPEPIFYAYAYPEPEGFKDYSVRPAAAYYNTDFREFVLPYEAVRRSAERDQALLEFLQTTYEAAAVSANWDRASLERADEPASEE